MLFADWGQARDGPAVADDDAGGGQASVMGSGPGWAGSVPPSGFMMGAAPALLLGDGEWRRA